MAYVRKTVDVWHIEGNCGYGWDIETTETSWKEAKEMAKCYRENCSYPIRIRKAREPKNNTQG